VNQVQAEKRLDEKNLLKTTLEQLKELNSPENPRFFEEFLEQFLQRAPKRLEELCATFELKNPVGLAKQAHSFNSNCLNVGAHVISAKLYELESLGENGGEHYDHEKARQILSELTTDYKNAEADLSGLIDGRFTLD
jgi:HPt (histidine-containing phosphotransfer) domain-containing protein